MKRLTILFIAIVFTLSATIAAPISFAEKVNKDTDWFDYENPKTFYKITTEEQLIGLASLVNENQIEKWKPTRLENFEGVTFTLTKDIQLTQNWKPIGSGTASHFSGIFDGNGHTISGLKIDSSSGNSGFFGYLTGEVRNLTLKGEIKSSDGNCGAFVGQLNSSARVIKCTSDVDISAKDKSGGIVGYSDGGVIENCINNGNVSGTFKIGGIVGENWGGSVSKSSNAGKVSSSQRGVATYGTGGIAGRSVAADAMLSECYNIGEISSYTEATGGIVGYTNAVGTTIENCYNIADITVKKEASNKELVKSWAGGIAGIVGTDGVIISNCYNSGKIKNADISGGVIGRYITNPYKDIEGRLENNYYSGELFKYGIGQSKKGNGEDIPNAIIGGNISGLSSALGAAYINDTTGIYGNGGNPVLRWQTPISPEQKTYLDDISKDIQIVLDKYLVKTADDSNHGQLILNTFNPKNFMTNALTLYNDAKEKKSLKSLNKNAQKNHDNKSDSENTKENTKEK